MEASVSQNGDAADAGQDTGQQEAQGQQVPQEVLDQLNTMNERFENIEPILTALQAPPEDDPEAEAGYGQYYDDETGEFDPDAFNQQVEERAKQIAQEQLTPFQQQMEQMQQRMLEDELADLAQEYPQLEDQEYMREFVPELQEQAAGFAQDFGLPEQFAQDLARNPNFIEMAHLARLAGQQAQQGVPAGDQGVHLEGGAGNPGQPQRDETQERFRALAQQGSASGPWGKPLDQL